MSQIPYATAYTPAPDRRPGAVTTFYVYCGLMALLYLGVAVLGGFFLVMAGGMAVDDPEMTQQEATVFGAMMLALGLVLALAFAIAPFLPRRTWAWVVGIILIALGLTSCLFWPLCIPLLVFYVQSPTRLWYGNGQAA